MTQRGEIRSFLVAGDEAEMKTEAAGVMIEQVIALRRERGDQLKMLCRMVEYCFKEEIDNRATKG